MAWIAIDLGTTGCRSLIFDDRLQIVGESYYEYPLITLSDLAIEQDANLWWELTKKTILEALRRSGIPAETIKGIGISTQGISVVPVDQNGNALRNAFSWLDRRAQQEAEKIEADFGAEGIFDLAGKPAMAAYTLPKLMWMKKHERKLYDSTYRFLLPHDYLVMKLTGEFLTDHTMAGGTLLYDIKKQGWSDEILEKEGIDRSKLPDIRWSGEGAGTLRSEVARELGLAESVVVAIGGQDQKCAALGAGIAGDVITLSLGTAGAIEKIYDYPFVDPARKTPSFSFLSPRMWIAEGVVDTAAGAMRWLKDTLFPDCGYGQMSALAQQALCSPLFFHPHLCGDSSVGNKKNACGNYYNISLHTKRGEFVSALLEGVGCEIKRIVSQMEAQEKPTAEIRIFGGGAKSDVWCHIIADITKKTVRKVSTEEAASAGAAMLAGIAQGSYDRDSAGELVSVSHAFEPEEILMRRYEKKYDDYMELYDRLWE